MLIHFHYRSGSIHYDVKLTISGQSVTHVVQAVKSAVTSINLPGKTSGTVSATGSITNTAYTSFDGRYIKPF